MKLTQVDLGGTLLETGHPLTELTGVGSIVSIILQAGISIAGIILLFLLIGGGIAMMSGGSANPEKVAKGKQAVTSAVIGFVVVFAAYWVVKLIEVITGIVLI